MVDTWFIYSIITLILVGLFSFLTKVSSERKHNKGVVLILLYFFFFLFALFLYFLFGDSGIINSTLFFIALGIGILNPLNLKTRFISLEYLSSSAYFINYRILSSTLLVFLGIIIFGDIINVFQIIGVLLGFLIFYLLLEKGQQKGLKNDMKKGVIFLLYGVLLISGINVLGKILATEGFNIYNYLLIYAFLGLMVTLLSNKKDISSVKKFLNLEYILLTFFMASSYIYNIIYITYAYVEGNLGIVYKIISYSIFIPSILSIIIYKEKVTPRKVLAFVLTIISLYLFAI